MTHAQLEKEYNKMEDKRRALFDKLAPYSADLLNKKPDAETWSAIQTINHMLTVELAALSYVKKKALDKTSAEKTGIKQWFRSMLLNRYLGSSRKFPAPTSVVPAVTYASLNEMREQWNAIRHDMKETLTAMPENLLGYGWFKHPSVGKLNLMQMLTFMQAHFDRHEKQVWRTIEEVS